MTYLGEPIELTEYAADLAAESFVHVILCFDWDEHKDLQIEEQCLEEHSCFNELLLEKRPGYARL